MARNVTIDGPIEIEAPTTPQVLRLWGGLIGDGAFNVSARSLTLRTAGKGEGGGETVFVGRVEDMPGYTQPRKRRKPRKPRSPRA